MLVDFLRANAEVFAWSPSDMPGISRDVAEHSKEVSDVKRHAGNFEPAETVKSVPLDPSNDASKQIQIGSKLDPK